VTLNVGGHRFLTTAATLAAVNGSYFAKLSRQAAAAAGRGRDNIEFFVDRSGKVTAWVEMQLLGGPSWAALYRDLCLDS
jgi:hypothetical protein